MKIRFVIPARSNMEVSQDIRGFRSEKADGQRFFSLMINVERRNIGEEKVEKTLRFLSLDL
jgi:hypothetical protein